MITGEFKSLTIGSLIEKLQDLKNQGFSEDTLIVHSSDSEGNRLNLLYDFSSTFQNGFYEEGDDVTFYKIDENGEEIYPPQKLSIEESNCIVIFP